MGWRGAIRSMQAEANRQARLSAKRDRLLQKQHEIETACDTVRSQSDQLELLVSLHHECTADFDWLHISEKPSPAEPNIVNFRTKIAEAKLTSFKPNFLHKALKLENMRRKRLRISIKNLS